MSQNRGVQKYVVQILYGKSFKKFKFYLDFFVVLGPFESLKFGAFRLKISF